MVKVAAISYLNTLPFIYGIKNHPVNEQVELIVCTPSEGADLLISGKADLGIVPIAAVPFIPESKFVSDYCIGATGKVASVLLCSGVPLDQIGTLYLDTESRTSVQLARILCRDYWCIAPDFTDFNFSRETLNPAASYVLIGDKALEHSGKFAYVYDLAAEWIAFRKIPFVFACWITNKKLDPAFLKDFNAALAYGVSHIAEAVEEADLKFSKPFARNYLLNNISYLFDKHKKEGVHDFWAIAPEELKSKVRW